MIKRVFDIAAASAGLVVLAPLLALIAIVVKLDSSGPAIFQQERIGKYFRPFRIYKFRTMVRDAASSGCGITFGDDRRISRAGRFLRRFKLDELPQLFNVLKGDMSLVGPRPELRKYVELYRRDFETVLQVRPGLTDFASLKYRHEATLLGRSPNPEDEYVRRVLPDKIELAKEYVRRSSLPLDCRLIIQTVCRIPTREFDEGFRA
jgi:lipopolysaccharide/colanic/teichoic acid biosynthesis glycosyltransferase